MEQTSTKHSLFCRHCDAACVGATHRLSDLTEKESNTQLNVSAANRFIAAALGGEEGDALKGAAAAGIPDKDSNKKRANSGGEQGGSSEAPKKKKAKTEDGSKKKVKKKKPAT